MIDDDELRRRFAELKRDDARRSPPFERLAASDAKPRRRVPLFVAIVPVLAAAAMLLLWCGAGMSKKAAAPASSVAAAPHRPMRVEAAAAMPLDFLLENAPVSVHLDADPIEGLRP